MIYAIVAAEGLYHGLHGIEHREIFEASDLETAHAIGTELSLEVMNSYDFIVEQLENDVEDEIQFNDTVKWTDTRVEQLRSEIYDDNVYYDLYELDEEKIKDKSAEELENELYNDLEEFLKKYQKEM